MSPEERQSEPNPYVCVRLWDWVPRCQGIPGIPAPLRVFTAALLLLLLTGLAGTAGCSHFAAVGRGGPIYAIAVDSVNGRKTATRGPVSYPACAIQVGDRVAQVWLADDSHGDVESPVVLQGDAAALKAGILVERTWSQAIVHKVTDEELAAGFAVVYVPGLPRPTTVELRFEPVRGGSVSRLVRPRPRPPATEARAATPTSRDNH